jgi:hypothetical protein
LLRANTAYIKEQLYSRFQQAEVAQGTLQGILTAGFFDYSQSGVLIAKRPMPPRSHR